MNIVLVVTVDSIYWVHIVFIVILSRRNLHLLQHVKLLLGFGDLFTFSFFSVQFIAENKSVRILGYTAMECVA